MDLAASPPTLDLAIWTSKINFTCAASGSSRPRDRVSEKTSSLAKLSLTIMALVISIVFALEMILKTR